MSRKRHQQLASSSITIAAPTFGAPALGVYDARKRQLDRDRQRACRDRKATRRDKKPKSPQSIHRICLSRLDEFDLINCKLLSTDLQIKKNGSFPEVGTLEYRQYVRKVIEDILKKVIELF